MNRFKNFTNNFKKTDGLLNKVNLLTNHFPNLQNAVNNTAETFKKTKSVTATLSTGFKGLWGIIKAHPIIAVITALSILNSIIDACIITTEEYNEILEKSRQTLNETTSKIESLSSELATTQDRIDELESKDSLTLVEQNELDKLKETNSELEAQIKLLQAQKNAQSITVANDTQNALESWESSKYIDKNVEWLHNSPFIGSYLKPNDKVTTGISNKEVLNWGLKAANQANQAYMQALNNGDIKSADSIKKQLDDINSGISEQINELNIYKESLESIDYSKLTKEQKQALDYINDVNYQYLLNQDRVNNASVVFDSIYNSDRFDKARQSLSELGNQGELTAEKIKELYQSNKDVKELLDYLSQLGLIDLSGTLIPANDSSGGSQFFDTFAGSVTTLSNSANESNTSLEQLANQLNKTKDSADETADSIEKLSKANEALDKNQEQYKSLSDIVQEYNENGYLSIDSLQAFSEMDTSVLPTLEFENGQVKLNSEAYKELTQQKLNELEVTQIRKMFSNILSMSVEEAQAYANAKAYTEQTNAIEGLINTEMQLAVIKARSLDKQNDTTAYSDAVQAAIPQVANIATLYEQSRSALNDSMDSMMGLTDATNDNKKALENQKSALENQKDALEKAKQEQEDYKKSLEDNKSSLEDLIKLTEDYIKQTKEDEKDALEESKKNISERIDKEIELLEAEKERHDQEKKMAESANELSKANLGMQIAGLDNSATGKQNYKKAKDEYNNVLSDYSEDAYERRYELKKQALEDYKDSEEERYDDLIDKIDEYLNDDVKLYRDACAMIDGDSQALYNNLLNYVHTYTTETDAEFNHMWNNAQSALSQYNDLHLSTFSLMDYLQGEIYNVEVVIEGYEQQINNVGDAINDVGSQIDSVTESVNRSASAVSNFSDAYNKAKDMVKGWQADYIINGKNITFASKLIDKKSAAQDIASQISAVLQGSVDMPWYGIYGSLKQYAQGTQSAEGGLSIVGEKGAELRVLNKGDSVIKNTITNRLIEFASDPMKFLGEAIKPLDFTNLLGTNYNKMLGTLSNNNFSQDNSCNPTVHINIQGDATQTTVKALQKESDNIVQKVMKQTLSIVDKNKNYAKW